MFSSPPPIWLGDHVCQSCRAGCPLEVAETITSRNRLRTLSDAGCRVNPNSLPRPGVCGDLDRNAVSQRPKDAPSGRVVRLPSVARAHRRASAPPPRSPRSRTRRPSRALSAAASRTRWTARPSAKSGEAAPPLAMAVTNPRVMWSWVAEDVPVRVVDRRRAGPCPRSRRGSAARGARPRPPGSPPRAGSCASRTWRAACRRCRGGPSRGAARTGPGSWASDDRWSEPVAPFSNSRSMMRRVLGDLERGAVRPRAARHEVAEQARSPPRISPKYQRARYTQCDPRSPEIPEPASPTSKRQAYSPDRP